MLGKALLRSPRWRELRRSATLRLAGHWKLAWWGTFLHSRDIVCFLPRLDAVSALRPPGLGNKLSSVGLVELAKLNSDVTLLHGLSAFGSNSYGDFRALGIHCVLGLSIGKLSCIDVNSGVRFSMLGALMVVFVLSGAWATRMAVRMFLSSCLKVWSLGTFDSGADF